MAKRFITKSDYCSGIQCPKILWMNENKKEERRSTGNESVLANGTRVGQLAREYFGNYSEVDFNIDGMAMVSQTSEFLKHGADVIAEASFVFEDLFCSVDLLKKNGDGYDIVEVKSSTSVSDIYLHDISFQKYVITNAGVNVKNTYILHINSEYIRRGELDLKKLFVIENCNDAVAQLQRNVPLLIKALSGIKNFPSEPPRDIGLYCDTPYDCPYKQYCGRHLPSPSVFDINRLHKKKKYDMYHNGIVSYGDIIAKKPPLNAAQQKQVDTAYYHYPPTIDRQGIQWFLDTLTYPLYHLDFETFQQAVPAWDGVHPYMQIPFQYSIHIQNEKQAQPQHLEFLAQHGTDPRRQLAEQLCKDIPKDVCVLAYNMSFEKNVIVALARSFPDLAEHLMNIHDNIKDLMKPFQYHHYYSEALHGSYSIKYVLPALCPNDPSLNYANLEGVHNGSEAMDAFASLGEHTAQEIAQIRQNLLAYCCLDTLAMVKILDKLYEITG